MLRSKAISTLEANRVETSQGTFLAAGGHQFRTLWVRDFCFAVPGLLSIGWEDLVGRQLELILSRQRADGLLPRGLDTVNPKWRVVRHTALRFLPSAPRAFMSGDLKAEYLGEHGTPAFDSGLLWIGSWAAWRRATGSTALDRREAIGNILRWTASFLHDGLLHQPPFSDWQDSARREGLLLHTQLLFLRAAREYLAVWPGADLPFEAAVFEDALRRFARLLPNGLLEETPGRGQASLETQLLVLSDPGLLPEIDRGALWKSLCVSELWKTPGLPVHPPYPAADVSWTTKAVGLRRYHDGFQWGWLAADLARIAYLRGDRDRGDRLLEELGRWDAEEKFLSEIYEDGAPVRTMLYRSESPFTWTAAKVLEALAAR